MKYTLYGSEASFYTGKVKAYLKYKPVDFLDKPSTLWVYKTIIIPKTGMSMIPVVETPTGEYLQDSTNIIDTIESSIPERAVYPTSAKQKLASLLLELFSDEWLLFPAMHYRWNFLNENYQFVTQAFGNTSIPWAPKFVQRWVGRQVAKRFAGFVPLIGINDTTKPAIESQFLCIVDCLENHFAQHQFFLGTRPSLADFAFIGPFHAHLYHDPYPRAILEKRAPNLVKWIQRMWQLDEISEFGEWLANDEVPESLNPLFEILFRDAWPFFKGASQRLSGYIKEKPNKKIPRGLGKIEFTINGVTSEKSCPTYNQWMMQRPIDNYRSLPENDKKEIDEWLNSINGYDSMQFEPEIQVSRINNRICAVN